MIHARDHAAAEPLVRLDDLDEYRRGFERYRGGEWDEERWTAWRVRFGVYGQRQPGVQMIRIKVPGGILPVAWLRPLARVNRVYADADAHVTTRQDIQIYGVPLGRTPDLLEELYRAGLTTREACGNTLRNMTACALAGACPREHVDAGAVAERLARSWIRHPLVQHMPRKVKISVSGCATDCGHSAIHDLAFVATRRDGAPGFRVLAGGGLGGSPMTAVEVLDFVAEEHLPTVVETLARLHQRYSDRRNRNAARIKFVAKRFGADTFARLFREEFARLRGLEQRPWQPLTWRTPREAAVPRMPTGVVRGHDGRDTVVAYVPLGLLSSDRLDRLADIAEAAGIAELRTTRDQNLALVGVPATLTFEVTAALAGLGLVVPDHADDVPTILSCPGTTTCRIGITNSQSLARRIEAEAAADPLARGISVHLSGCQNSCGLHHVADIGLHGMAKKIDGRAAPHYQLHLGGDARTGDIGLAGPVVPARLAHRAVGLLRAAYAAGRNDGEGLRGWAARLGKDGLAAVLAPLDGADADGLFVDWGEAAGFAGAPTMRGECAAPFAPDELLADLADDGLLDLDRRHAAGDWAEALRAGEAACVFAIRRLLHLRGHGTEDGLSAAEAFAALRAVWADTPDVTATLEAVEAERATALGTGHIDTWREAVMVLLDTVRAIVEQPASPPAMGNLDLLLGAAE